MIVHSVIASNFGSYEYVTFEPDNKGLCLISGPTGVVSQPSQTL